MITNSSRTCQYLVTIHEVGNITGDPRNIHTILTSTDHILPRDRVVVEVVDCFPGETPR